MVLSLTKEAARQLQMWCATKPVTHGARHKEGVTLQADFESEGQARFVVLGLGSAVKVLKPAELRNWVKIEISVMARNVVES